MIIIRYIVSDGQTFGTTRQALPRTPSTGARQPSIARLDPRHSRSPRHDHRPVGKAHGSPTTTHRRAGKRGSLRKDHGAKSGARGSSNGLPPCLCPCPGKTSDADAGSARRSNRKEQTCSGGANDASGRPRGPRSEFQGRSTTAPNKSTSTSTGPALGRGVNSLKEEPDGATPLTAEERDSLIPSHVTLRRELNELEQQNILEADIWAFARSRNPVDEPFGRQLHTRMFGEVWRWAGSYRTTNKNIGVDREVIRTRLYESLDNYRYWIEHQTFAPDEIAARFHHTLVLVHPFPNGNGRWSRMMADVLAVRLGQSRFTWGSNSLDAAGQTRRAYIETLKAADRHDYSRLTPFARS